MAFYNPANPHQRHNPFSQKKLLLIDVFDPNDETLGTREDPRNINIRIKDKKDGLEEMVDRIIHIADSCDGSILRLRIHGHGRPGWQSVSHGVDGGFRERRKNLRELKGKIKVDGLLGRAPDELEISKQTFAHEQAQLRYDEDMSQYKQGLNLSTLKQTEPVLKRLTPYFHTDGEVILMGCQVALGTVGDNFLKGLSSIWGVPVSGSEDYTSKLWKGSGPQGLQGNVKTCSPIECKTNTVWGRMLMDPGFFP